MQRDNSFYCGGTGIPSNIVTLNGKVARNLGLELPWGAIRFIRFSYPRIRTLADMDEEEIIALEIQYNCKVLRS